MLLWGLPPSSGIFPAKHFTQWIQIATTTLGHNGSSPPFVDDSSENAWRCFSSAAGFMPYIYFFYFTVQTILFQFNHQNEVLFLFLLFLLAPFNTFKFQRNSYIYSLAVILTLLGQKNSSQQPPQEHGVHVGSIPLPGYQQWHDDVSELEEYF